MDWKWDFSGLLWHPVEKSSYKISGLLWKPSYKKKLFQGCYDKLQNHISGNLDLAIGTVVGVAAAQLLAIVFAFCLCRFLFCALHAHEELDNRELGSTQRWIQRKWTGWGQSRMKIWIVIQGCMTKIWKIWWKNGNNFFGYLDDFLEFCNKLTTFLLPANSPHPGKHLGFCMFLEILLQGRIYKPKLRRLNLIKKKIHFSLFFLFLFLPCRAVGQERDYHYKY